MATDLRERNRKMLAMSKAGATLRAIGEAYEMTAAGVYFAIRTVEPGFSAKRARRGLPSEQSEDYQRTCENPACGKTFIIRARTSEQKFCSRPCFLDAHGRFTDPVRNAAIAERAHAGETYEEIGYAYGITRERVRQIYRAAYPDESRTSTRPPRIEVRTCANPECNKDFTARTYTSTLYCSRVCSSQMHRLNTPFSKAFQRAQRAYLLRVEGWSWSDIMQKMRYKNMATAINSAKNAAKWHAWEWPVRLNNHPSSRYGGYMKSRLKRPKGHGHETVAHGRGADATADA